MIVDMSKISIVGYAGDRRGIIRRLQQLAVVQMEEYNLDGEEREEVLSFASYDDASERIVQVEGELSKVNSALSFLREMAVNKQSVTKGQVQFNELVDPNAYKDTWKHVFSVIRTKDAITQTKADINNENNRILTLKPWETLDIPLQEKGTKHTEQYCGTIPNAVNFSDLEGKMQKADLGVMQVISQDNAQYYVSLILHKSAKEELLSLVKQYGFTEVSFADMTGLMMQNIEALHRSIKELEKRLSELKAAAQEQIKDVEKIQRLYDYLVNLIERRKVRNKILTTDKAFFVGGWVPSDKFAEVKQIIESNFCATVEEGKPKEDEAFPIQLDNPKVVYPFQLITELYSLPNRWEIDPNAVMGFFYFFFFGMMLSDAGYGIILTTVCFLVLKLFRFEGMIDKLVRLLMYCGISTTIWGALFGGWFGNAGEMLLGKDPAIWFNPILDPMTMLVLSLILGVVHLFAGMGVQGYMLIKKGKLLDAIYDIGFWYLLISGIGFLFFGGTLAAVGKYMAIGGAVGLVLTQGRHEKHIIKKLFGGFASLYNITSFLSDILSYSRLLALGLATAVIAMVVNTMGALSGLDNIGGILLFTVVFLVGHAFNLAISALGAYVHASRLQYVEFFGKFYQGGGKAFRPLQFKNKFVQLNIK